MVDRGLLEVVEVHRVVDVAEGIHFMKSDAETLLEQLSVKIRDGSRTVSHAAVPRCDTRFGTIGVASADSIVCWKIRRRMAIVEAYVESIPW